MSGIYPNWVAPDTSSLTEYAEEVIYPSWIIHHVGMVVRQLMSTITVVSATQPASGLVNRLLSSQISAASETVNIDAFAHRNLLSNIVINSITSEVDANSSVVGFIFTETGMRLVTIKRRIISDH